MIKELIASVEVDQPILSRLPFDEALMKPLEPEPQPEPEPEQPEVVCFLKKEDME